MKKGPMKGASVVPEEAMRDYLRDNGCLMTAWRIDH
jgi:hypothetical protein